MNSRELIQALQEFKDQKNVDKETMRDILESVFRLVLAKNYGSDSNFDLIINIEKGDFEIWRIREVVPDGAVEDSNSQIALSDAKLLQSDYEVGEEVSEEVKFDEFARRNILAIRQNLAGRIMDYERENLYNRYKQREGELVTAQLHQIRRREAILLDDDGNELILPKSEQIPSDFFRKGESVRAVVLRVELGNSTPQIILSRTAPRFLECLMEQEIPEIFDGLITIKKAVRIPGERAKVAVESYDDRIDPVGACVGMKGVRIQGIERELRHENVDVLSYTTNAQLYVSRALNPAKITSIRINEEEKHADVLLPAQEVSLAIGKNGYNIRLASDLTGYKIDVFRDSEPQEGEGEDVMLEEFSDVIEGWVLEELRRIGCDTAQSVLETPKEELMRRADLEEKTVDEVLRILRSEFEED